MSGRTPRGARKKAAPRAAPTKEKRARRSPEEARALILEACQRSLVRDGPDAVGLKDVAREAGVSHALVTHYFGTIDALLQAALEDYAERQRRAAIERILRQPELGPREWMKQFFEWGGREETARILAFSFLKGLITREDFFSRKQRGMRRVVDAIVERLSGQGTPGVVREDIEFICLLVIAATHGYALGKQGYWPSLGVDQPTEVHDAFFFDRLTELVEVFALARARPA